MSILDFIRQYFCFVFPVIQTSSNNVVQDSQQFYGNIVASSAGTCISGIYIDLWLGKRSELSLYSSGARTSVIRLLKSEVNMAETDVLNL
jgi:hypothetical protein